MVSKNVDNFIKQSTINAMATKFTQIQPQKKSCEQCSGTGKVSSIAHTK